MSLEKRIKRLEEVIGQIGQVHIVFKDNFQFDLIRQDNSRISYKPVQTFLDFHKDTTHYFKYIQGAYGSGKSSGCMADILWKARQMPPWKNGVRNTRAIFIRNTYPDLQSTTFRTWLNWFGQVGMAEIKRQPVFIATHYWRFYDEVTDEYGNIELEVQFLALDTERDLKKLDSLEASYAYMNETRHLPEELIDRLIGRLGRFPARQDAIYNPIIVADSNPPSTRHWIYERFEKNCPEGWRKFTQPPGLIKNEKGKWIENPAHDTANYLPQDYYTRMSQGGSEEFVKVYCLGEYGLDKSGKQVYAEYNDDLHSGDLVYPVPGLPLLLGWDFGLTPACVIIQQLPIGTILVLKEFTTTRMGIRELAETKVLPYLTTELNGYQIKESIGDPAGVASSQITISDSCINTLCELGIPTSPASTNNLVARIEAVKYFLRLLIDGKAAIQISRKNAEILREGFLGGYHYRRISGVELNKYGEFPEKNEFSHIHDALQYIVLGLVPKVSKSEISSDYLRRLQVPLQR